MREGKTVLVRPIVYRDREGVIWCKGCLNAQRVFRTALVKAAFNETDDFEACCITCFRMRYLNEESVAYVA